MQVVAETVTAVTVHLAVDSSFLHVWWSILAWPWVQALLPLAVLITLILFVWIFVPVPGSLRFNSDYEIIDSADGKTRWCAPHHNRYSARVLVSIVKCRNSISMSSNDSQKVEGSCQALMKTLPLFPSAMAVHLLVSLRTLMLLHVHIVMHALLLISCNNCAGQSFT